MELMNKVFDSSDISLHNNNKDCWVIINAKVYDVTNFLNEHPGGDNVLLDVAGKDASEQFEEVGHGSAARLMLDEYYVGEVNHVTPPVVISKTIISKSESYFTKQDKRLGLNTVIKPSRLVVLFAVLGVAIGCLLYK